MDEVGAVLLVGAVAALIAVWAIVSQRAVARSRATLDIIVFSEADTAFSAARKRFVELAKGGGLAVWADEANEKSSETQAIRLVLNEFELIAIGIQRGIIDYELYKRWYRSGVLMHWKCAAPFVTGLRARVGNDAIYYEFEEMVRWMKDNHMPKRKISSWWRG